MSARYGLDNFRTTQEYPNPKLAEIPNANPVVYGNWRSGMDARKRLCSDSTQPTTLRPGEMQCHS
jgi:hypothetical protein